MNNHYWALGAAVALGLPGAANAAVVIQDISLPGIAGYQTSVGTPINLFDPSLGDLTSIVLGVSVRQDTLGGKTGLTRYTFNDAGFITGTFIGGSDDFAQVQVNVPASAFADFIGTGTFTPSVRATNGLSSPIRDTSIDFFADFVGHNYIDFFYTPATAAVPEPATWGMMILGMGAVGFVLRRRQKVTTRVSFAQKLRELK